MKKNGWWFLLYASVIIQSICSQTFWFTQPLTILKIMEGPQRACTYVSPSCQLLLYQK